VPTPADPLPASSGDTDLERALLSAEHASPSPRPATAAATQDSPAVTPKTRPQQASPSAFISRSPPSLAAGRYRLHPQLRDRLPVRQGAWVAWSTLALCAATATGLMNTNPAIAVAGAIGLGAWAAWPDRFVLGPLISLAAVGAALLVGLLTGKDASVVALAGSQVLAAGAVTGLGATFMDRTPTDGWRRAQGVLGGAAGAGVGWWAATTIVGAPGQDAVIGALQGLALGLVASQTLLAATLEWKRTDRIPRPGRIRATLSERFRAPCLRAWQLDRAFARQAPDPDARDGLGEVCAWVYRLQWTRMVLNQEIAALDGQDRDGQDIEARRDALIERARSSNDTFTAERLRATAGHLDQLAAHRDSLALERDRTAAMSEYASAFLEEARAGLALARVQPGEQVPDRLGDVLTRLRSHADAGDARRKTARELSALA